MAGLSAAGHRTWRFFYTFHEYITLASTQNLPARHLKRPNHDPSRPKQWTSTSTSTIAPPPSPPGHQRNEQRRQQQQQQRHQPNPVTPTPQTHYSLFPQSLPLGAPPRGPFTVDPTALRREFLSLQSRAHPDMHAAGPDKARAEGMSARINEAYRTLLSPLRRAEYILSLQEGGGGGGGETDAGADVMGEERVEGEEGGFLAEVLDVRERVEGAESWDEVHELGRENEERVRRCEEDLGRLVEEGRWGEARKEVARLRYWMGIRDVIENWGEDGKGEGRGSGSGR